MKPLFTILVLVIFSNVFAITTSSIENLIYSPIYITMLISFSIHLIVFIPSNFLKTEKFYDITGTMTFITIIYYTLISKNDHFDFSLNIRAYTLVIIISIWTLRLGLFLLYRILKTGEDTRFSNLKKNTTTFLIPWTLSAMWVFITASPATIVISSTKNINNDIFLIVGLLIWSFGFIFECIADYQKFKFNSEIINKNKFINHGLWSISRHPNYFGEIILWIGISIISYPALSGFEHITLLSPFFVYLLLTRVSGINLLEKKSDSKWGDNKEYKFYKQKTPILIPFFRKY